MKTLHLKIKGNFPPVHIKQLGVKTPFLINSAVFKCLETLLITEQAIKCQGKGSVILLKRYNFQAQSVQRLATGWTTEGLESR
jgi:hypothetical protein